jgi:hypothetical protein
MTAAVRGRNFELEPSRPSLTFVLVVCALLCSFAFCTFDFEMDAAHTPLSRVTDFSPTRSMTAIEISVPVALLLIRFIPTGSSRYPSSCAAADSMASRLVFLFPFVLKPSAKFSYGCGLQGSTGFHAFLHV